MCGFTNFAAHTQHACISDMFLVLDFELRKRKVAYPGNAILEKPGYVLNDCLRRGDECGIR